MNTSLRCFIAIDIPDQIKKDICELIEIFKKYDMDVKWVSYENLHITLKFLGNTFGDLIPKISDILGNILLPFEPFYIKIYSVGVFPNRKHPRVVWVGIKDSEILIQLQEDIEKSMALLGYQKEDRKFQPHLTVGRVRSPKGISNLINELDMFKEKHFGNVKVEDVKLMESRLKPSGAEYFCLRMIPLGRRKSEY